MSWLWQKDQARAAPVQAQPQDQGNALVAHNLAIPLLSRLLAEFRSSSCYGTDNKEVAKQHCKQVDQRPLESPANLALVLNYVLAHTLVSLLCLEVHVSFVFVLHVSFVFALRKTL